MLKSIFKAPAFLVILLTIFSCSKKSDPTSSYIIDASKVSLYYDETHQFVITQGSTAASADSFAWTSSDPTVGTISTSGVFTGKKIGTTTVTATGNGTTLKSEVTITPYSTLCTEPYFDATASAAVTKSKEKRTLVSETASALLYAGENAKVTNVSYLYANNLMSSASLLLANTPDVIAETGKFFKERYAYVGNDLGADFYTDNKQVLIGVGTDKNLGFYAIYVPFSADAVASKSVKQTASDAIKKALSNFRQVK